MQMALLAILALASQPAPACVAYHPRPLSVPADAAYRTAEGKVRVVGYNDMAEMLGALGAAFTVHQPGIAFDFVLKGTRTAPLALLNRSSAFAPMGAEFTAADLSSWRVTNTSDPLVVQVAKDSLDPRALSSPLGIFVNAANPLARMTLPKLHRVLTTPGLRWGALGLSGAWAQRPVHVLGLSPNLALSLFMRNHILGGKAITPALQGYAKSRQVVEAVAQDPLAIGFADLSHAEPRVHVLALADKPSGPWHDGSPADLQSGLYPLERQLLIYARREEMRGIPGAFIAFTLSCEGQAIIANGDLGYLPLDSRQLKHERKNTGSLQVSAS